MKVTFTKTAERRYRVAVEGPGVVAAAMEPAPGYDPRLPHDMAHFVVENELGIAGGIFGQLAQGGHSGTFRPLDKQPGKVARRGTRVAAANRKDAILSEQVVWLAWQAWTNEAPELQPVAGMSPEDLRRICRVFDEVSAVWSTLSIGGSMTLEWHGDAKRKGPRGSSRKRVGR